MIIITLFLEFIACYLIIGLCGATDFSQILIGYLIVAIVTITLYVAKKQIIPNDSNCEKCEKCGKAFSMHEISKKSIGSFETTMDVTRQVKNSTGETISTYEESVPATCYIYECIDECKYCGYQKIVKRNKTYRK